MFIVRIQMTSQTSLTGHSLSYAMHMAAGFVLRLNGLVALGRFQVIMMNSVRSVINTIVMTYRFSPFYNTSAGISAMFLCVSQIYFSLRKNMDAFFCFGIV